MRLRYICGSDAVLSIIFMTCMTEGLRLGAVKDNDTTTKIYFIMLAA
jgi:hypothetical protein